MLTVANAKRDFSIGYLRSFSILRDPLSSGWNVDIEDINGRRSFLVDARSKTARVFKTLDAAVSALEDIGFKISSLSI